MYWKEEDMWVRSWADAVQLYICKYCSDLQINHKNNNNIKHYATDARTVEWERERESILDCVCALFNYDFKSIVCCEQKMSGRFVSEHCKRKLKQINFRA